jgi:hypothetical protein
VRDQLETYLARARERERVVPRLSSELRGVGHPASDAGSAEAAALQEKATSRS